MNKAKITTTKIVFSLMFICIMISLLLGYNVPGDRNNELHKVFPDNSLVLYPESWISESKKTCFLNQFSSSDHTIDILYPLDNQTTISGLEPVGFNVSDNANLKDIVIYTNDDFISTLAIDGDFIDEIFIPLFNNGTNIITLQAIWDDFSNANDSVEVDSTFIFPQIELKEGDVLNYYYNEIDSSVEGYYNFTFNEWLSPFEMNTSLEIELWNESSIIASSENYLVINTLNGYVSEDSSLQFLYNHFFAFGRNIPGAISGDKTVFEEWNDIITLTGYLSWRYTDVWTFEKIDRNRTVYFERSSNILYYFKENNTSEMTLLETSVDFQKPTVSSPPDIEYTVGDLGNNISWIATDMNPSTYELYRNDNLFVNSKSWQSGIPIMINVDELMSGTYIYRIEVIDLAGNKVQDSVIVTVISNSSETNSVPLIFILSELIIIIAVIKKKKKETKAF